MSKRTIISLLAVTCITTLLLGACGKKEPAPVAPAEGQQQTADAAEDGIQAESIQAESMDALVTEVFGRIQQYDAEALCHLPVVNENRLFDSLAGSDQVTAGSVGELLLQYWTEKGAKLSYQVIKVDEEAATAEVECTYAGSNSFYEHYLKNEYTLEMTEGMEEEAFEIACMKKAMEEADQDETQVVTVVLIAQKGDRGYELKNLSREFADVALAGLLSAEDANATPAGLEEDTPEEQAVQAIADSLQYEILEGPGGAAIALTGNQEKENVECDFNVILLDDQGKELDTVFHEFNFLPKGVTQYVSVLVSEPYSSIKVSVDTTEGYMINRTEDVAWEKKADSREVRLTNTGDELIDFVTITMLYYQGDTFVGCNTEWIYELQPSAAETLAIDAPHSIETQEALAYDRCEVTVTAASYLPVG